MMDSPLLVTCGLPYTNGPCHVGHLRTYVPADFYVRFLRHAGEDVVFVCGSDNHGTPVVVSAEEEGVSPRELSMRYHRHFLDCFQRMHVVFDHFGMTDGETNHRRTQAIVQSLINNGHIYSQVVQQSYCPECARFLPDRYVEGICPHCGVPARGDECDMGCGRHLEPGEIREPRCRVCGTLALLQEQEHYFFRLSDFHNFLLDYLDTLEGTSNARNYAIGWVKEGLRDWCISRTLEWGVKFPGQDDLVVYVWVDAPIGYISFTEEWAEKAGTDWKKYWCGDARVTHFIGSDIIYHHCVFWPAMLKGAGYGVPYAVVASGMVKIDDQKFSKSRGYVVWTDEDYLDQGLPADYLRYYLLSYTSHTKELNFSWKVFQERINNEVVGTLGNFIHRTLHFAQKFYGGVPEGMATPEVRDQISATLANAEQAIREYEFKNAVDSIVALAAFGNSYIQKSAPWQLVKTDPEAARRVIRDCLQLVKALALLTDPIMPERASRIWKMLGYGDAVTGHTFREALEDLPVQQLPRPSPAFEKVEDEKVTALEATLRMRVERAKAKGAKEVHMGTVTIDEFARMDLRVARVLTVEEVKGSNKLYVMQVDLGEGETRQIVSGIAPFYAPEDLMGKDVVVIANLKPSRIFGVESQGMLLAAGEAASLLVPLRTVPPGTKIC
ncbi:MAG: methionine--tRNA ligase [Methanomicrobiales archaeon]|nr:methionine--tRNA ligase [Methanomicrobiales archaeon]